MTRPATAKQKDMPLYPDEATIARAVLGPRAPMWSGLARELERQGLPRINPMTGGRYWPAVQRFLDRFEGLDDLQSAHVGLTKESW